MLKFYISMLLACFSVFTMTVSAATVKDSEPASSLAKIYYNGDVDRPSVSRLISILDEVNKNDNIKRIYLYIDSYGGDMDAGLMASIAIKSSKIPVTTVAMSNVASSATLMFCAADDRRSLPVAYLTFHPAFFEPNSQLRPDDINEINTRSKIFNGVFKQTYKLCTNLTDDVIDSILYSESNRKTFSPEESIKINAISTIDTKIVQAEKNYYVTSDGSDG